MALNMDWRVSDKGQIQQPANSTNQRTKTDGKTPIAVRLIKMSMMNKIAIFGKSTLNLSILLVRPPRTKRKADSDSLVQDPNRVTS